MILFPLNPLASACFPCITYFDMLKNKILNYQIYLLKQPSFYFPLTLVHSPHIITPSYFFHFLILTFPTISFINLLFYLNIPSKIASFLHFFIYPLKVSHYLILIYFIFVIIYHIYIIIHHIIKTSRATCLHWFMVFPCFHRSTNCF